MLSKFRPKYRLEYRIKYRIKYRSKFAFKLLKALHRSRFLKNGVLVHCSPQWFGVMRVNGIGGNQENIPFNFKIFHKLASLLSEI